MYALKRGPRWCYEVDADAYVAELRAEVEKLKGALAIKEKKEESDLLNYVRSLGKCKFN